MSSPRPIIVDDTDTRIRYIGQGWFQDNGSQDQFGNYGPTYKHTLHGTTASNSLAFSFKGTSVKIMGTTNLAKLDDTHYDPSWECFVDNVSIGANKPFPYRENNWVMCESDNLSDGAHEITVNITITKGNTFWFDAVQFLPSPSETYDTEVLVVDNHDPGIEWGAGWGSLGDTANQTGTHGATARFNFTGTGLSWIGFIPTELPHAASTGSYSIDGGDPVSFALNGLAADATTTVYNQIFFTTPQLSAGPHSILVTYTGDSTHTPLTLDYIYLTNKTLPASSSSSTATHADPSSPAGGSTSKTPVGPIVGGVLGGIVILALIAALLFFLRRRPRKQQRMSIISTGDPGMSPFMSTYGHNQASHPQPPHSPLYPTGPPVAPAPAAPSSVGSYDPYGGYLPASSYNGSMTISSGQQATQQSHQPQAYGHNQSHSMSSEPSSGVGYNWGTGAVAAAAAAASAATPSSQALRKEREAAEERAQHQPEVIHHQDSGVRLGPPAPRVVEEIPPMYSPI